MAKASSFMQFSYVSAVVQTFQPLSTAFPGVVIGSWTELSVSLGHLCCLPLTALEPWPAS